MRKILLTSLFSLIHFTGGVVAYRMRDGSTPPILNEDGRQIPGSIASLEKVELGGMEQWILTREKNVSDPVLLRPHGGPGVAQMPIARYFNEALEKIFIVVHWDQRGAGKSNPANFDERRVTFQQFLNDAHELTLLLKNCFGKDKIYLVGHSWGSQLGIRLAAAYPQDYYAYVGVSQVINSPLVQEIGNDWLLQEIKREPLGYRSPFFVGLPGFHSELWAPDENRTDFQGIYEMKFISRRALSGSLPFRIKRNGRNPRSYR